MPDEYERGSLGSGLNLGPPHFQIHDTGWALIVIVAFLLIGIPLIIWLSM